MKLRSMSVRRIHVKMVLHAMTMWGSTHVTVCLALKASAVRWKSMSVSVCHASTMAHVLIWRTGKSYCALVKKMASLFKKL